MPSTIFVEKIWSRSHRLPNSKHYQIYGCLLYCRLSHGHVRIIFILKITQKNA